MNHDVFYESYMQLDENEPKEDVNMRVSPIRAVSLPQTHFGFRLGVGLLNHKLFRFTSQNNASSHSPHIHSTMLLMRLTVATQLSFSFL